MRKRTKIICTLGPASSSAKIISNLIKEGTDVFRINLSHSSVEQTAKIINVIKSASLKQGRPVATLVDLQGQKIRIGTFGTKKHILLKTNSEFILDATLSIDKGTSKSVGLTLKSLPKHLDEGDELLLSDALIKLEVTSVVKSKIYTKVIRGGKLKSSQGINKKGGGLSLKGITDKDMKDLREAIKLDIDYVAVSFVRDAEDIKTIKKIIGKKRIGIIAKIERNEALENIDEIVKISDGLLVARGDLGVEIGIEQLPAVQDRLIRKAISYDKLVIVATQMMESMIDSLTPSRAEVNDVANSVMDGADAVMLSGETSVGQYPVQVIERMSDIIKTVENSELIDVPQKPPHIRTKRFITKSICYHAANMANEINARAISTLTNSGYTAFQISAWRPDAHILVFSSNKRIISQLNLLWGVRAFHYDKFASTDQTINDVNKIAFDKGYVEADDMVISLAAMPMKDKGMVNTLRVSEVKDYSKL